MISGIEKFYCKSRLHSYLWRSRANRIFPDFIEYTPPSPFVLELGTGQGLGAIFLAEKLKGSRFIAIDNEHDMVKAAIENVERNDLEERRGISYRGF
ncbi:MAG: class I SAM-dependent methyltransferase [Candidatus Methanoperedens sp.]|nr:class I SAM-dependent methyltransferase [Candidatus Methanoperedens sp.]